MDIFQRLFNSLMGFLRAQSWVHSLLHYIQPPLVQSYLNSMLPITYMQTIHIFTWNLTLGTLGILVPLNWQIALRPSTRGWEIINLNPNKMEFLAIGDDKIRSSMKSSFPVSFLGYIMEPAESVKTLGSSWMLTIQCIDIIYRLIYVTHVTTISPNYMKGPQVCKSWNNCEGGKCLCKQSPGLL